MKGRAYFWLWLLGLGMALGIAAWQSYPGYMDAAYYFGGGLQLSRGAGFYEPYIWTYLDDPAGLPHPSHGYWMPLASILSALGMWLSGHHTFAVGRLPFILLASLIPPLTARLALTLDQNRQRAWLAGLFALFSGYYASFLPTTDNFSPYMVLGAAYFLLLAPSPKGTLTARRFFLAGVVTGLLNLARSDGLLWLPMTWLAIGLLWKKAGARGWPFWKSVGAHGIAALAGYLAIMGPWYLRNLRVYGALFSAAPRRALWLRFYNETFIYPPDILSPQHLLEAGWKAILEARLWALGENAQTALAGQGLIVLFPLILIGLWKYRQEVRVQVGALGWLGTYWSLSTLFPFAGARGGFFHAGAVLQPLWFALAPSGLDALLTWAARRRGWHLPQAQRVFRSALVVIVAILTAYLVWTRVIRLGWGEGEQYYPQVEQFLVQAGARPEDVIMVLNPPACFIMTGRPAVVAPYADAPAVLQIARRYGVRYLALEADASTLPFYHNVDSMPQFRYLGTVSGVRIFEIR
jgi:hypothetical protein